jgi:putative FmdB family regulatory protein
VIYEYSCAVCGDMEITQSMHDDTLTNCPECGTNEFTKLFSDPMFTYCKGEATTLVQLADANTKRLGRAEIQEREAVGKEQRDKRLKELSQQRGGTPLKGSAKRPFWRDGKDGTEASDTPLDLTKVKSAERYIQTGIKS